MSVSIEYNAAKGNEGESLVAYSIGLGEDIKQLLLSSLINGEECSLSLESADNNGYGCLNINGNKNEIQIHKNDSSTEVAQIVHVDEKPILQHVGDLIGSLQIHSATSSTVSKLVDLKKTAKKDRDSEERAIKTVVQSHLLASFMAPSISTIDDVLYRHCVHTVLLHEAKPLEELIQSTANSLTEAGVTLSNIPQAKIRFALLSICEKCGDVYSISDRELHGLVMSQWIWKKEERSLVSGVFQRRKRRENHTETAPTEPEKKRKKEEGREEEWKDVSLIIPNHRFVQSNWLLDGFYRDRIDAAIKAFVVFKEEAKKDEVVFDDYLKLKGETIMLGCIMEKILRKSEAEYEEIKQSIQRDQSVQDDDRSLVEEYIKLLKDKRKHDKALIEKYLKEQDEFFRVMEE